MLVLPHLALALLAAHSCSMRSLKLLERLSDAGIAGIANCRCVVAQLSRRPNSTIGRHDHRRKLGPRIAPWLAQLDKKASCIKQQTNQLQGLPFLCHAPGRQPEPFAELVWCPYLCHAPSR